MNRTLSLTRTILLLLALLAAASCDARSEPTVQPVEARTLVGELRGDSTAPQTAVTGWIVIEEGTDMPIPVDISAVVGIAQQMAGNRVAVEGTITERVDAAGEKQTVFVARSIDLATGPRVGEVTPDADPTTQPR